MTVCRRVRDCRVFRGRDGFTLVEALAALAIASAIMIASAALIRNVATFFDRGTRGASEAERLMLAVGPVTIIVVSLVIGTLIISIMSALLSITELAQ